MVIWSNTVENVLSRIFLEGIARTGQIPDIYGEAKTQLEKLDKTCLTITSKIDQYCPVGWRRNNYPILKVSKNNMSLKFAYTKRKLNNGETLVIVEEVADANGNILTENIKHTHINMNKNKKIVRLTESDLHNMIA